jgi:hypothetical protein
MKGMLGVVPEILAMEQLQLVRLERIITLPQDRGDRLVGLDGELRSARVSRPRRRT